MSGIEIAWKFRFSLALLLMVVIVTIGLKAYGWKSSQLAAERMLVSSYKAERDQANKDRDKQATALGDREIRNARLQEENNRLRRQIKGVLDTPAGRGWSAAPLPAGLAERLQLVVQDPAVPTADPSLPPRPDSGAGDERIDQRRSSRLESQSAQQPADVQ